MVDGAGASALGSANDSPESPLIGAVRIPRGSSIAALPNPASAGPVAYQGREIRRIDSLCADNAIPGRVLPCPSRLPALVSLSTSLRPAQRLGRSHEQR